MGVVAVGRDGSERFRLLTGKHVWIAAVTATRAYVPDGAHEAYVLDLLGGHVASRLAVSVPWLLPTQSVAVPED